MKIHFSDLLYAFSYGLDCVESQLLPIAGGHGKRVARFCILLGKTLGMDKEELMELAGLNGREKLAGYDVESVICYEGK